MTPLRKALDRTLLLMRDDLGVQVSDNELLEALTSTSVSLVADHESLSCHATQSAFVTAAILMARSGHAVYLTAPDLPLLAPQPPLAQGNLVTSLLALNGEILPNIKFTAGAPAHRVDLAVSFGPNLQLPKANNIIAITAGPWNARISTLHESMSWERPCTPPFGGLAGGALVAAEAFKLAMRKLRKFATHPEHFDAAFATTEDTTFELAPADTPLPNKLDHFDFVSGGAITNATLYCLARIPDVQGKAKVIEPDKGEPSNLNRYMLLLKSQLFISKAQQLAALNLHGLTIQPVEEWFGPRTLQKIEPLASRVLVGVDHIPTRWEVQKTNPLWLGIGATTHWSAMASYHVKGLPCAKCLHHRDDPTVAPIPTVAFVSFMSGLLLATYFLRAVGAKDVPSQEQQVYLTLPRPELPWRSAIAFRHDCAIQCSS